MASDANTTIAQKLYETVLARYGSAADIDAWATALDAGTLSQTQVMADFVGSPEAVSYIYPLIGLYQGFFGRTPDTGGLEFWAQAFESGASLQSIATSFAGVWDQEGASGGLANTPTNFLTVLYSNLFGRAPDASGLSFWTSYLNQNGNTAAAQGQVFVDFLNSAEFQANLSAWNQSISTWLTEVAQDNLIPPFELPGDGDIYVSFVPAYTTLENPQGIVSSVATADLTVSQNGSIGPGSPFAVADLNISVAPSVTSIIADSTHFPFISASQTVTPFNVLDGATIQNVTVTGGSPSTHFQIGGESNGLYLPVFGDAAFQSLDASGYLGQISLYLDGTNFGANTYIAGSGAGNFLFFDQTPGTNGPFGGGTVANFQTIEFVAPYAGGSGLFELPVPTADTPSVGRSVTLLDATHFTGLKLLELAGSDIGVIGLESGVTVAVGDQGNQGYADGAPLTYQPGSTLGIYLENPSSGLNLILNDGGGYNGVSAGLYAYEANLTGANAITIVTNASGTLTFNAPEIVPDQSFDLAIVDGSATSLVFSGGQAGQVVALDQDGIPGSVTTIDATGLQSNFIMGPTARYLDVAFADAPAPLTFVGGSGWNVIELANAEDNLSGGTSGHNTLIVDLTQPEGPIAITLGGTVGNEVTQFPGASSPPTVTGFDNLDMSFIGLDMAYAGGTGTATVQVLSNGGSAYDTYSTTGALIQSYDFVILPNTLAATVNLPSTAAFSSTIVALDGNYFPGLAGDANGTFTNYDTITNFGGAAGQRSGTAADEFAFATSYAGSATTGPLTSISSGGVNLLSGSAAFAYEIVGTAAVDLTSEADVIATLGALKTQANMGFRLVEFNNADPNSATQFAVYEVSLGNPHFANDLGASDTIKLLAIFDTSNGWDSGLFYHSGTIHSV